MLGHDPSNCTCRINFKAIFLIIVCGVHIIYHVQIWYYHSPAKSLPKINETPLKGSMGYTPTVTVPETKSEQGHWNYP